MWRPRGSRGKADFTVSTYAGDLLKPDEIKLPDYARLHSRTGSHAVTSDGRYFVSWDDGLYGLRVIDLKEHKESGALALRGCGPFTWTVGHDVYSVCQDTRELVRISIDAQGRPKVAGRAKVLPADFTGARTVGWAADAKQGLLIDAGGDVYLPDFSHGLPSAPLKPVGNAGRAEGRFADSVINSTAKQRRRRLHRLRRQSRLGAGRRQVRGRPVRCRRLPLHRRPAAEEARCDRHRGDRLRL